MLPELQRFLLCGLALWQRHIEVPQQLGYYESLLSELPRYSTPTVACRGTWAHLLHQVPIQGPLVHQFKSLFSLAFMLLFLHCLSQAPIFHLLVLASGRVTADLCCQLLGFIEALPVSAQVNFIPN